MGNTERHNFYVSEHCVLSAPRLPGAASSGWEVKAGRRADRVGPVTGGRWRGPAVSCSRFTPRPAASPAGQRQSGALRGWAHDPILGLARSAHQYKTRGWMLPAPRPPHTPRPQTRENAPH